MQRDTAILQSTNRHNISDLLQTARSLETKFEWDSALNIYEDILASLSKKSLDYAILCDRSGYAAYRSAMQSKTSRLFREIMTKAIYHYTGAKESLGEVKDGTAQWRIPKVEAMLSYLQYWLATDQAHKFKLLEQGWTNAKTCLKSLERSGDRLNFGKAYNESFPIANLCYHFIRDLELRTQFSRETVQLGEQAVASLKDKNEPIELARAYVYTTNFIFFTPDTGPEDSALIDEKARQYWKKAVEASGDTAWVEAAWIGGGPDFGDSMEGGIKACQHALSYVLQTRDNLLIGFIYDWMAQYAGLRSPMVDDADEASAILDQALDWASIAREHYKIIAFRTPRAGMLHIEWPEPEYFVTKSWIATHLAERRNMLTRAEMQLPGLLALAKSSRYPLRLIDAHHVCGKVYLYRSKLEEHRPTRERLLRQAIWHEREAMRLHGETEGRLARFSFLFLSYLADLKFELAKNCSDRTATIRLLNEAIKDKQRASEQFEHYSEAFRNTMEDYYVSWRGKMASALGRFFDELFIISRDEGALVDAREQFLKAARSIEFQQPSRAAENYWRVAQRSSTLNDHSGAAEKFDLAMKSYELAARNIPSLANFYLTQAAYMNVWNRIERARESHRNHQYLVARDLYNEAADLLKQSERKAYISSAYRALALLESAEDKSRRELGEEAVLEFDAASQAFAESRVSIELGERDDLGDANEYHPLPELLQTARQRVDFCRARSEIEKARVSDKNGKHREGTLRYQRAIDILGELVPDLPSGPEKNEGQFMISLAKAWQTMSRAEEEISPVLFARASELFKHSKEVSTSQISRLLVLGHSKYCKALEKAFLFLESGKLSEEIAASRYLESATGYYLQAGLQNASDQAIATRQFLEGQVQLNFAIRERNPEKKAQIYSSAEKMFRSASTGFGETGNIAKRDDILRIIERVRDEKDLAISLIGDMARPVILSAHTIPRTNTSMQSAAGVEVFESAYVQAYLVATPIRPKIGERLNLRIEFSNAGMSPAQLVKIEKAIPDSFDLVENPQEIAVQSNHLILNGRRLGPLKTDQVSLVLKPRLQGTVAVSPRILYLDENGRDRSHEPRPLDIIVETSSQARQDTLAGRETKVVSPIMSFLTEAFRLDYFVKRLTLEHAGWRGLPELVMKLKIPRSQVYGDSRYGHTFGKPLERLIKNGTVEFRVLPGQRGRGGQIRKVRANYESSSVKGIVDRRDRW